jgi:hypothetical protein
MTSEARTHLRNALSELERAHEAVTSPEAGGLEPQGLAEGLMIGRLVTQVAEYLGRSVGSVWFDEPVLRDEQTITLPPAAPERSVEENLRLIHAVQRSLPTLAATRGIETLDKSDVGRLKALIGYAKDALVGSDYGYALDASRDCDVDGIQY